MKRRVVLASLGTLGTTGVAGCSGVISSDSTQSLTDAASTTTTPVEAQVDVPPCPERPDSFTRESVRQFAIDFEKGYVVREVLADDELVVAVNFIDVAGEPLETVTQVESGWTVHFTVVGPVIRFHPSHTPPHKDPSRYVANYFISQQRVHRATTAPNKKADPREKGKEVHCPLQ